MSDSYDSLDCSLLDSSVHGICQAKILEWVLISFSRGSSQPRDWTRVSCIVGGFFTAEPPGKPLVIISQFSSVTQSRPALCNPMDCSTPSLPVHHQLPEFTHTHIHWVGDAIQPSHLLLSPSPPDFNLSQHQGLFQWVSSLHQAAKVLELIIDATLFVIDVCKI